MKKRREAGGARLAGVAEPEACGVVVAKGAGAALGRRAVVEEDEAGPAGEQARGGLGFAAAGEDSGEDFLLPQRVGEAGHEVEEGGLREARQPVAGAGADGKIVQRAGDPGGLLPR